MKVHRKKSTRELRKAGTEFDAAIGTSFRIVFKDADRNFMYIVLLNKAG